MKIILGICLLALCSFTLAQITSVSNGFYGGRSGDIVIYDKSFVPDDSVLVLLNKYYEIPSIKETEVGDLLSHLLQTAPLNPDASRDDFPTIDYFAKPKANLLFVFESVYGASKFDGTKIALKSESYLGSSLSKLTNMLTSSTPDAHGIVADSWLDRFSGNSMSAYSSWDARVNPAVASIADILSLVSSGEGLSFAFSASPSLARALAVKPFLLSKSSSPSSLRAQQALSWDEYYLRSIYDDDDPSFARILKITKEKVIQFAKDNLAVEFLSNGEFKWSTFSFAGRCDFEILVELCLINEFSNQLQSAILSSSSNLGQMSVDNILDFFSFGFKSIKHLECKYGKDSEEIAFVFKFFEEGIKKIANSVQQVYGADNVITEILFVKANNHSNNVNNKDIKTIIKNVLPRDAASKLSVEQFYPDIYVDFLDQTVSSLRETVCSSLSTALAKFSDISVECMPIPVTAGKRQEGGLEASSTSNADEAGTFQIALWTAVVLIISFLLGSLIMLSIDASSDSLLYAYDINHPNAGKSLY